MKRFDCRAFGRRGRHERRPVALVHHWDGDGNHLGWSQHEAPADPRFGGCIEHEHDPEFPAVTACWCGLWWYADEHEDAPEHEHAQLPDPITWTDALPY